MKTDFGIALKISSRFNNCSETDQGEWAEFVGIDIEHPASNVLVRDKANMIYSVDVNRIVDELFINEPEGPRAA